MSILPPGPDSTTLTVPRPAPRSGAASELTHLVCFCRINATPRLALCGHDCTHEPRGDTGSPCGVCHDLVDGRGCEFCRAREVEP